MKSNVDLATAVIPAAFWTRLHRDGLASFAPPVALRHSVHLQLAPTATDAQKQAMVEALRALPHQIPEIAELACGLDAGLTPSGNHSFALTVDFHSASGYKVYASHPAHLAVISSHIKPILVPGSRTAVQYARL